METRSKLTKLLRYLALSPYDWRYTLKLPYYFLAPGLSKHFLQKKAPISDRKKTASEKTTKFVFAGDLMLLKGQSIPQLSQPLLTLINSADYFVANCEAAVVNAPLNRDDASNVTFTMPIAYLEGIFDQLSIPSQKVILGVANNHSRDVTQEIFDKGLQSIQSKLGFNVIGKYIEDKAPCQILTTESGSRFAMAAWTHLMNGERALDDRLIVNRDKQVKNFDWLAFKRSNQIEYLIGLPHWGHEFQHFPYKETFEQAENFMAEGFDALIGGHSHLLQPLSLINNKPCCFSLGNFCSVDYHWRTKLISLFEMELSDTGELASYQYHFFYQVQREKQVFLVPINELPKKLKFKVDKLLATVFEM